MSLCHLLVAFLALIAVLQPVLADDKRDLLCLVNKERAQRGLPCLAIDPRLNEAARRHSIDQGRMRKMSHKGSNGSEVGQRITAVGFPWKEVAENVAHTYPDIPKVMQAWVKSPGHYANIMKRYMTHMGYARETNPQGMLFHTQVFGGDGKKYNNPMC
ncbi:CAP domain-containing protein [Thamnocephalis sphaerospora]|uniref:CAP domain-containing protein n=1 Tax=Thamnocephalis sphaerospora TaxID=78915 RepID=A0A4P9XMG8_9FUNG|nr:CAP domain-containing protein [Thamnocephalis sphaerospora]|eukprot:RKP07075.1 CAP domain-containing protein [Thamnocephalis sphaerospora]